MKATPIELIRRYQDAAAKYAAKAMKGRDNSHPATPHYQTISAVFAGEAMRLLFKLLDKKG